MILQGDLAAALKAIGIDAEVQVSLAGIPLPIIGVRLDEFRGMIFLDLCRPDSEDGLRDFLGRMSTALHDDGGRQEHAVRRNARGHLELLRGGE